MNEEQVKKSILSHFGLRPDVTFFSNPVGNGWTDHGSRIRFGLHPGSSDFIGWITINGVAVFLAFEVKSPTGRASDAQENFIQQVRAAGGIAGVVRSPEDCELLISEYKTGNASERRGGHQL